MIYPFVSAHIGVGAAILCHQQLCHPQVRLGDVYGVFETLFINPHSFLLSDSHRFPGPGGADPAARVQSALPEVEQGAIGAGIGVQQGLELVAVAVEIRTSGHVVGVGVQIQVQLHAGESSFTDLFQ